MSRISYRLKDTADGTFLNEPACDCDRLGLDRCVKRCRLWDKEQPK